LEEWERVREGISALAPDSVDREDAGYALLGLADLGTGDTTAALARLESIVQDTARLPG
jgi:NaMN:DMB phosphoribosyltransferase